MLVVFSHNKYLYRSPVWLKRCGLRDHFATPPSSRSRPRSRPWCLLMSPRTAPCWRLVDVGRPRGGGRLLWTRDILLGSLPETPVFRRTGPRTRSGPILLSRTRAGLWCARPSWGASTPVQTGVISISCRSSF